MAALSLDVEALRSAAIDGMRNAYRELIEQLAAVRPGDDLYGFGFYSHQGLYLGVTAFSEQGLQEVVSQYEANSLSGDRPNLKPRSREAWRVALRWCPADSPLHNLVDGHLHKAEEIMDAANEAYDQRSAEEPEWDPDFKQSVALRDLIYDTLVEALCALDTEGLFGPTRERLTLNVWEGDQSYEDRVDFAERCNPPAVAARFAAEELASYG